MISEEFSTWYLFGATSDFVGGFPIADSKIALCTGNPRDSLPGRCIGAEDATFVDVRLIRKSKDVCRKPPVDRIAAGVDFFLVVRRRVLNVLREYELCDSIRFIDCNIRTAERQLIWDHEYVIGVAYYAWNVADYDRSIVEWAEGVDGQPVALRVETWVLKDDSIPECDLFRSMPGGWFISRRLKERLEEEGCTGMRFTAVEAS